MPVQGSRVPGCEGSSTVVEGLRCGGDKNPCTFRFRFPGGAAPPRGVPRMPAPSIKVCPILNPAY